MRGIGLKAWHEGREPEVMSGRLPRTVIAPVNPQPNVWRNANLAHSPDFRVGEYIFLSGMGPVAPAAGTRDRARPERVRASCRRF
jgi:hypothetical protein